MKLIIFFKRVVNFLKTHTIKQIIKRIFRISTSYTKEAEYLIWINNNEPKIEELKKDKEFIPKYKYKFSFIVDYNSDEEIIKSIKNQTYNNLEIIRYSKNDDVNVIISKTKGQYIIFMYNNVLFSSFMLYEVLREIEKNNSDIIYSDSDNIRKINKEDNLIYERFSPIFKPDFAIDTLRANNYIGSVLVIKKDVINDSVRFCNNYYNKIFDILFKAYENNLKISHISKVLYHEKSSVNLVKYISEEKEIIKDHFDRIGMNAIVEEGKYNGQYYIKYKIAGKSKVSIIIPNMDHVEDLKKCIESIKKSTYDNYEIVIVENNSKNEETFNYYKELELDNKIKVLKFSISYFNYSNIVNFGVKNSSGKYIILLNNDVEIITNNWIENMIMYAQREDIGVVGAKLLFEDNSIQHAGVIIGIRGLAGHLYREISEDDSSKYKNIDLIQNLSAVTAACMMVKRDTFNEVWGFDENFAVNFNDVDFCLKVREKGLLNLYNPFVQAYHYESKSRGIDTENKEKIKEFEKEYNLFINRWKKEIAIGDPYFNKNYRLDVDDLKINYCKIFYEK